MVQGGKAGTFSPAGRADSVCRNLQPTPVSQQAVSTGLPSDPSIQPEQVFWAGQGWADQVVRLLFALNVLALVLHALLPD
jgi:hypothetical protein